MGPEISLRENSAFLCYTTVCSAQRGLRIAADGTRHSSETGESSPKPFAFAEILREAGRSREPPTSERLEL